MFLVNRVYNYWTKHKGPTDIVLYVTFVKLYPRVDKLEFNPVNLNYLATNFADCYQDDAVSMESASQLSPTMPPLFDFSEIVTAIRETTDVYKANKTVAPIDTHSTYVTWNHKILPPDVQARYLIKQQSTAIQTSASSTLYYYKVEVPGSLDPDTHVSTVTTRHVTRHYWSDGLHN